VRMASRGFSETGLGRWRPRDDPAAHCVAVPLAPPTVSLSSLGNPPALPGDSQIMRSA
jgi:hypothetical protein